MEGIPMVAFHPLIRDKSWFELKTPALSVEFLNEVHDGWSGS
jgi:hypothetical protein